VRHSNRIDFKEEFSKLAIHGSTYSVIIRKPNANIFKTIQL
jgi:phage portal protein BeeE